MATRTRRPKPTVVTETAEEITEEEARQLLRDKEVLRVNACLEEIQAVLDKYNYMLTVEPRFTPDGRITGTVSLAKKPKGGGNNVPL